MIVDVDEELRQSERARETKARWERGQVKDEIIK